MNVAEQRLEVAPAAQGSGGLRHPEFFFADCFGARDSDEVDGAVGWALATDPKTLVLNPRILGGVAS